MGISEIFIILAGLPLFEQ